VTVKYKLGQIGKISLKNRIQDTHVLESERLITPQKVKMKFPGTRKTFETVLTGRQELEKILNFQDTRIFIIVGPCSIHDPKSAWEYANRLKRLASLVKSTMLIIMRVYFEKPRTTTGWKGFINDPDLNGSFNIEKGILFARNLLVKIADLGLPTATEALDPIIPQYLADLITWSAIGARTTESQTHRELASGLSMPVGFKNSTDGSVQTALNAVKAARVPHHFLGINQNGQTAIFRTTGNPYAHIVLRGGENQPNYDSKSIEHCENLLEKNNLPKAIVVDCSHANSNKNYNLQPKIFKELINQIKLGNRSIVGAMLESHLNDGNQHFPQKISELKYGVSITDACIGWDKTEEIILSVHQSLKKIRKL
jgi:3-deoxy-7-phosphoheptulonate synthase